MRRVTASEVVADLDNVKECLDRHGRWAIMLIKGGKVTGSGYGYAIQGDAGGAGYILAVNDDTLELN